MKKIFLTFIAAVTVFAAQGQTAYDALFFSKQYYLGSARTVAMGNAFTSLGGDLGALSVNPAASAVYKYSEVVFTPAVNFNSARTTYFGTEVKDNSSKLYFSNFGMVSAFGSKNNKNTNVNFSVAVNRLNDYSGRYSVSGQSSSYSWLASMAGYLYNLQGSSRIHAADMDITNNYNPFYDNTSAPWKFILAWNSTLLDTLSNGYDYVAATENVTPNSFVIGGDLVYDFLRETTGANDEIVFNIGGSLSKKFYYGFNLGIQTITYTDYQEYSESAVNPDDFQSQFSSFTHSYSLSTKGAGVNLKAGFIYLPAKGIRIGGSIATPTWYSMKDEWSEDIRSYFDDGYNTSISSPLGMYDYNLKTPGRVNLGASFLFNNRGLISFDYEGVDYSSIVLSSATRHTFDSQNDQIASEFRFTNNFRVGFEYKYMPNVSFRGGYNYCQNPEINYGKDRHIGSIGVGFSGGKGFYADFALQQTFFNENFSLTPVNDNTAPIAELNSSSLKAFLSVGFKF